MFRIKYVVYIPLVCGLLASFWLLFSYIAGCSSSDDIALTLLDREIKKRSIFLQKLLESLKKREQQQVQLLTEIEDLKQTVKEQINITQRAESVVTTGSQFNINSSVPIIYGITPTYKRLTQKADLTRLCQTFLHIVNFHWIVVEDAVSKTDLVERLLARCGVKYTHLAVRTSELLVRAKNDPRWLKARGVEQRNAGLAWLRINITKETRGVVYFIDDDNTYDLEIFEQIRQTKKVSVWPVGLVGGLMWEGPVCENGKVVKFYTAWGLTRPFPIDMAGFAINLKLLLDNPAAVLDVKASRGHVESSLLKLLVKRHELEPKADNCKKILVWHTQTAEPKMKQEIRLRKIGKQSDPSLEV